MKTRFIKSLANVRDFAAAKKENEYLLQETEKFKCLEYLSYNCLNFDAWCKSDICHSQKLVFLVEFPDSHEKLYHVACWY